MLFVEEPVNLKKNAGAKITAVVASLFALLVGWGLVHQNPPVNASASQAASSTTANTANTANVPNTGATGSAASSNFGASQPAPPPVTYYHVRTHVS